MLYRKDSGHQDRFKMTVIGTLVVLIQGVPGEDRCVLLLGYEEQIVVIVVMFQVRPNVYLSLWM
jgi:hypothetical protein